MIIGKEDQTTSLIGKTEEEEDDKLIGKGVKEQEEKPLIGTVEQEQTQEQPSEVSYSTDQPEDEPIEEPKQPEEEDPDLLDYAADIALAPLRGVEGAAEGIYGFLDYVSGDRLWDWDRDKNSAFNKLGLEAKSQTTIGRFGESITQFAVGFIPGLGLASKAGKVLQVSKLGKASGAVSKALGKMAKGNKSLDPKTLKTLSKLKGSTKAAVRNASAGAFSDFLVWKGEEERISNLLQSFEGMGDSSIVEWMAYDPDKDESELEGRFKNALEGLVVGELMGLAFYGGKKAFKAIPEKDKAVEGLTKVFGKFRDKNKNISQQIAEGKEPNELEAIESALNNEANKLTDDEIKAISELNKRNTDYSKIAEAQAITGVPANKIPVAESINRVIKEAQEAKEKIKFTKIDSDKATEEQLDAWLRKNTDIPPSVMSEATKRETIKDILKQGDKGGVEVTIRRMEEALVTKMKKVGVFEETNPQAMLSGLRAVEDVPEVRSLLSRVAKDLLKKGTKDEFDLEKSAEFYKETEEIIGLGIESAGGKRDSLNLESLRKTPEDLKRVRAEAEVLYQALGVASRQIKESLENAKKAIDPKGVGYIETNLEGAGKRTMNGEEALMDLFNSVERFTSIQEIWADFGTQLSLGLRQRNSLYKTGESSLGRDIEGQYRPLGVAIERASSNAGIALRRAHSRGYSEKKIIKDLEKLFKRTSTDTGIGKEVDMGAFIDGLKNEVGTNNSLSKFILVKRKGLAVTQEWYYNAILSSPTTWAVNLIGGALVLPLRHIESMIGGVATGNMDLVKANMRAMFDFQSFGESLRYAWKSGIDEEARSIEGFTAYKNDRSYAPKGEIRVNNPEGNTLKSAWNVIGTAVRHPSRIMMAGDEFFKQMSFRSRTKTALALEGYKRGLHKAPNKLAEFINDGFNELITKDGRFRNEDNVRKEAQLALNRKLQEGEVIENRSAFINQYVNDHFLNNKLTLEDGVISNVLSREARQEMVDAGTDWALVNTFTNEVQNKFFKTTGKMATMSPWLGFVIPFVRTPSNILLFALGRTIPYGAGKEVFQARNFKKDLEGLSFDDIAQRLGDDANMPAAKQQAEELLSIIQNEAGIKQAEAIGRLSFGVMAAGTMFMNVERIRERITGGEPESPGLKEVWRNTGKQPYSIKFGDTWYSYQRLDPFATILGIMADTVHLHDDAMQERKVSEFRDPEEEYSAQEPYLRTLFGVVATTMAKNVSNKSYIKNIGELIEILEEPDRVIGNIAGNVASAMLVPSNVNWSQNVFEEDAPLLEARDILDKIKKRIPESLRGGEPLMPKRNFLGEIQRKESTGNVVKALNPIFQSTASNDVVDLELEQHAVGRQRPNIIKSYKGRQYDLTQVRNEKGQTAYDRYLELMGTVKSGGAYINLRQDLRRIINSNSYQNLPPVTSENSDKNHPRTKALSASFRRYKSEAFRQLVREFGDFFQ